MTEGRTARPATASPAVVGQRLSWLEKTLESVVGNQLGAGVYRRWVESLGLAGDERVLEVGTGAGACARHLAEALPLGTLTCLEIDSRWLDLARRRLAGFGARVEFVQGDASEWSRSAGFDVVVCHFVLHDMSTDERATALRRIETSTVPGGYLFVREPIGHGMGERELLAQLSSAGFEPVLMRHGAVALMGETIEGSWSR